MQAIVFLNLNTYFGRALTIISKSIFHEISSAKAAYFPGPAQILRDSGEVTNHSTAMFPGPSAAAPQNKIDTFFPSSFPREDQDDRVYAGAGGL